MSKEHFTYSKLKFLNKKNENVKKLKIRKCVCEEIHESLPVKCE